jgi:putative sterol carrier protein
MMTVEPLLQDLVRKFNEKVQSDDKLRCELDGMDKKVLIDLETEKYNFHMCDKMINDFQSGSITDPDITLESDPETIQGLIEGKIKPMKAFALRKVRVKGEIDDILRLRKLF